MLAVATGALGFGLLGAEFRVSTEILPMGKFVAAGYVLFFYAALVRSVRGILRSDGVTTGEDVVRGPLVYLSLVVLYVVFIFVIGVFDRPADNPLPA